MKIRSLLLSFACLATLHLPAMESIRERLGAHLTQGVTAAQIQAERCPICHTTFEAQQLDQLFMIRCGNHRLIFDEGCLRSWAHANPEELRCLICQRSLTPARPADMAEILAANQFGGDIQGIQPHKILISLVLTVLLEALVYGKETHLTALTQLRPILIFCGLWLVNQRLPLRYSVALVALLGAILFYQH